MSTAKDPLKHPGESSISWTLTQAARLHRIHLNKKLADIGLFAGQEQVLQALGTHDAITMSELAAILRVRPPTASKSVKRMAVLGLVESHCDLHDARTVRVRLTGKGRTAVARIRELWEEVERDVVAEMNSTEQRRLRKLLLRAARNLAEARGDDMQDFKVPDDHQAGRKRNSYKTDVLMPAE